MARKMFDVNGNEIRRRYRTDVWMDLRRGEPSEYVRPGFPKMEDGSIEKAGKLIMRGLAARIACWDRMEGRYVWTVEKGKRVPGTRIYQPIVTRGEA